MRRRNNVALLILFLLTALFLANAQTKATTPNQPPTVPSASSQSPADSPSTSQAPSNNPALGPDSADSGTFVFRKQVDEVVLHATVIDDKQHIVTSLDKGDFNVYEAVSYTHLRAHETDSYLVCRLLLEKKKKNK